MRRALKIARQALAMGEMSSIDSTPPSDPELPDQANYIAPVAWTANGLTKSGTTYLETATNGAHYLNGSAYARAAGVRRMRAQMDITPVNGRTAGAFYVYDSTSTKYATGFFDIANGSASTGGPWTSQACSLVDLGGGTWRVLLDFTTDASTTGLRCQYLMVNGSQSYLGDVTKGQKIENEFVFDRDAGGG